MRADLPASGGAGEQRSALDACGAEVLPVALRVLRARVEGGALLVNEDGRIGPGVGALRFAVSLPRGEGRSDTGRERPEPGPPCLRHVEGDGAALEVEVPPREARELSEAKAFPMEHAVGNAPRKRHDTRGEERAIFVGENVALRLLVPELGEEAAGKRARGDELERVNRHGQKPVKELRHMSPRRCAALGGDPAHHLLRMGEGEGVEAHAAEHWVDVELEPRHVVARAFFCLDVVGPIARELA